MSDRARVLWLSRCIGLGGVERLLVAMASRIDHDRFDVHVAFVTAADETFSEELRALGVTVHDLHGRGWPLRVWALVRRGRFDVVHSHSPLPGVFARLTRKRHLLVHTEHNRWSAYQAVTRALNRATIRRNDRVYAVSGQVLDSMDRPARGFAPTVMYQGFDDAAVVAVDDRTRAVGREALGLAGSDTVIGTVGNLRWTKNHAGLLRSVVRLRELDPSRTLRVVIIGEGPLRDDLQAQVRELGLSEEVALLGSRRDVPTLLPAFDVYVISSTEEGLPLALLEALDTGLPVVTTDAGGIGEVVTDDVAELVPVDDDDALASAVDRLLSDPQRRAVLQAAGPRRAREFSVGAAVTALETLYASAGRAV